MTVIRSFDDHDYWPEYGTFLIVDAEHAPARHPLDRALRERGMLFGSIAIAGDGWIAGPATDHHHRATLELHDGPPEDDDPEWVDVVESPFGSGGVVGLGMLMGGYPDDRFRLDGVGLYRFRFARRPHRDGDASHYRVQFWRVEAPPEPPRWLRRSRELASAANGGLRTTTDDLVITLRWAGVAGLETPTPWLADRLATTTDIIDEALRWIEAQDLMRPDPPDLRHLSPHQRAYAKRRGAALPARPPHAGPPQAAPPQAMPPRPAGPPAKPVPDGIPASRRPVVTTPARPRRIEPPAMPGGPRRVYPYERLPLGRPPRHGAVTRHGSVVVWDGGGQPTVVATVRPDPVRAVTTPHGIVVLGGHEAILVRPDGELTLLGAHVRPTVGITARGRVAIVEDVLGLVPRSRLVLVDPLTGGRSVHQADGLLGVTGTHDETVYTWGRGTLRFSPGAEPEPAPDAIRAVYPDGTLLALNGPTTLIIAPDGSRREAPVGPQARLAPGMDFFYWYGYQPPVLFLVPADRPDAEPTVIALPYHARPPASSEHGAAWEDRSHLLLPIRGGPDAVRVDVRTGVLELAPLVPEAAHGVVLVESV